MLWSRLAHPEGPLMLNRITPSHGPFVDGDELFKPYNSQNKTPKTRAFPPEPRHHHDRSLPLTMARNNKPSKKNIKGHNGITSSRKDNDSKKSHQQTTKLHEKGPIYINQKQNQPPTRLARPITMRPKKNNLRNQSDTA
jgi:hypothetical protein